MKEKNNMKMVKYPNNDLYQSRKSAFQKVLKTTTSSQPSPPHPPPPHPHPFVQQSRKYFRAKKVIWLRLLQGADLHLFQTRFVIGWENNRGGDMTMPLSLKTISSAGYSGAPAGAAEHHG